MFRRIAKTIFGLTFGIFRKLLLIAFDYDLNVLLSSKSIKEDFDYHQKAIQIEECLNNNNNSNAEEGGGGGGATDLWKLRELALSRGGLLEGRSTTY